jgi:DNA-binding PadR family transcriptional regulator
MTLTYDQREALRMLAGSPNGSTESIMLAHGFAIGVLRDLVRDGLATAEPRTVRSGRRLIEVKWMRITDAGRRALSLRGFIE